MCLYRTGYLATFCASSRSRVKISVNSPVQFVMLGVHVLRRCARWNTRRVVGAQSKRTCVTSIGQNPVTHEIPTESVSVETNVIGQLDPLRKIGIVFTCTVCETRSAKSFSHKSYTEGVVIIRCPSCNNNHLIADNLGWFKDEKINVETMAQEKGQKVRRLSNIQELNGENDIQGLEKFKELFSQVATQTPKTSE